MHIYKNNIYTEYPKERVCVIDFLACAQDAYTRTFELLKVLGGTQDAWLKRYSDITRIFYHYCFECMEVYFNRCPSKLRKVFVVYTVNKKDGFSVFFNKHSKAVLNSSPYPFCVVQTYNSPEIPVAANRALEGKQVSYKKFTNFIKSNNLTQLSKQLEKKFISSNIRVDFSK